MSGTITMPNMASTKASPLTKTARVAVRAETAIASSFSRLPARSSR